LGRLDETESQLALAVGGSHATEHLFCFLIRLAGCIPAASYGVLTRLFVVTVTKVVGFEKRRKASCKIVFIETLSAGAFRDHCTSTDPNRTKQNHTTEEMSTLWRGNLPALGDRKTGGQRPQDQDSTSIPVQMHDLPVSLSPLSSGD